MEFKMNEWIGNWTNFENYIYSDDAVMKRCWEEAEAYAKKMPMFKGGVKAFWQMACDTVNEENTVRLGGWKISEADDGMEVEWLDATGNSLGKYHYKVADVIKKGLEAKENFLFEAMNAPESCPFHYVLAMEPMPERGARLEGGLLSHLHFQYASSLELLLKEGALCKPMWYATMCDGEGALLEKCNIVRALHRMPVWEQLAEN